MGLHVDFRKGRRGAKFRRKSKGYVTLGGVDMRFILPT